MPCTCWYDPPEESKKFIKERCIEIVDELKRLNRGGVPLGCELQDVHKLIDHLWDPTRCKEREEFFKSFLE